LTPEELPPAEAQRSVEKMRRTIDTPWSSSASETLTAWFNHLPIASGGQYSGAMEPPERLGKSPQMAFAPVLILRKRRPRIMATALEDVAKRIESEGRVPEGVGEVTGDPSHEGAGAFAPGPDRESCDTPTDVLFPLPFNEEQIKILDRLKGRTGVLVQGPPAGPCNLLTRRDESV
jgi:hypothetical protein